MIDSCIWDKLAVKIDEAQSEVGDAGWVKWVIQVVEFIIDDW